MAAKVWLLVRVIVIGWWQFFPLPKGGESYVSKDTCVGPILADVPIMTHVSVEKTDLAAGQIRVRWRSPFEADPGQFPPPYRYALYRAVGFARGDDSVLVANNLTAPDTTFLDTGLNTEDNVYNYSVTAYASNNIELVHLFQRLPSGLQRSRRWEVFS